MVEQRFRIQNTPLLFSFQNVRKQSEVIWKDSFCGTALRLAIGFMLVELILLSWQWHRLPPQVPLYYSRPWGEMQLAPPWALFFLPGLSAAVLVVDVFLGGRVFESEKLLAR